MTLSNFIKQTYSKLAVAIIMLIVSGYGAMQIPEVVNFMQTPIGWIMAMVAINLVTPMCMFIAKSPDEGFLSYLMLGMQGTFAGIAISPLLYLAASFTKGSISGESLILASMGITGLVFSAITFYVWKRGKFWDPSEALMLGGFLVLTAAIPLNGLVLHSGVLGYIILTVLGLLGTFQLVKGTNDIMEGSITDPNEGALTLFAGIFNLFQVILIFMMDGLGSD
jgi:Inhibitor of apoptosis-promoting Bax1